MFINSDHSYSFVTKDVRAKNRVEFKRQLKLYINERDPRVLCTFDDMLPSFNLVVTNVSINFPYWGRLIIPELKRMSEGVGYDMDYTTVIRDEQRIIFHFSPAIDYIVKKER